MIKAYICRYRTTVDAGQLSQGKGGHAHGGAPPAADKTAARSSKTKVSRLEFERVRRHDLSTKATAQKPAPGARRHVKRHAARRMGRGGRVAEGARLESVFTGNRNVGSNPTPSASILKDRFSGPHDQPRNARDWSGLAKDLRTVGCYRLDGAVLWPPFFLRGSVLPSRSTDFSEPVFRAYSLPFTPAEFESLVLGQFESR